MFWVTSPQACGLLIVGKGPGVVPAIHIRVPRHQQGGLVALALDCLNMLSDAYAWQNNVSTHSMTNAASSNSQHSKQTSSQ